MKIVLTRLNEWKGFINDTKQMLPSPNLSFTSILIFIIFVSIVVIFLDIHGCFFFLWVICDFQSFWPCKCMWSKNNVDGRVWCRNWKWCWTWNFFDFLFPLFNVFLFFIPPIWAYISFLKSCSYLYFDVDDWSFFSWLYCILDFGFLL